VTTLANLRRQLDLARAAMPAPPGPRVLNSEQMLCEVQRLLADVEANPSAEPQPFNPAAYSPEDAALILEVEKSQAEYVADVEDAFTIKLRADAEARRRQWVAREGVTS
jgi:hypothetical protein